MSEPEEAREQRLRELAESKGFNLQKWGEGTPITSFQYALIDQKTYWCVLDRHQGLDFVEAYLMNFAD